MSSISKIGLAFTTYAVRPVGAAEGSDSVDGDTRKSGDRHNPDNRQNAMDHMRQQKQQPPSFDPDAWARQMHVRIQLMKQLG